LPPKKLLKDLPLKDLPLKDLPLKDLPLKDLPLKDLPMPSFTIRDLERRVQARAGESAEVSYTRKLLDRGVDQCAKKLGEEVVEAAIAAVSDDRQGLVREAADVLYHLLVLLHARGISLDEVEAELAARSRQSGLEEKAARKKSETSG
jgi:phosphoribosyl-ATP pyrophosphohydrolase